jgi:hypothetical protein
MFQLSNPFKKPPAKVFAKDTLEDYNHLYIVSQEASEYHAKMADFYKQGIKRMQTYLSTEPISNAAP